MLIQLLGIVIVEAYDGKASDLSYLKHENYVLTTVHDRDSDREYIIKSTHVVACDGAKSAVRRFLGVESEGEDSCMVSLADVEGDTRTD